MRENYINPKLFSMGMVVVPASITIEKGISVQKYKCKLKNKVSIYKKKTRRAVVRITGSDFVKKWGLLNKTNRKVKIKLIKKNKKWLLILTRTAKYGKILQVYSGSHPCFQLVLNKHLPKNLWNLIKSKKTYTFPVNVIFNLSEWKDINLKPYDFLPEVEKLPKKLMEKALKLGFNVDFVPKGRSYDLELIGPKGNKFLIAVSSHVAKNESRSKEKRKQKILMDISKMLTILNKNLYPIIISEPLEFDGSWSFTTDSYLNFYKKKFGFKFLTTNFEEKWENKICKDLLIIDKTINRKV